MRVIKAAMGGVGAEDSGLASLDTPEGSEDAPIHWKQVRASVAKIGIRRAERR